MNAAFSISLLILTLYFSYNIASSKASGNDAGCLCERYTCGCCAHLDIPQVHLNDTGCINITYLPNDYGISLTMTVDGWTLFNETISARSPPPICFGAPMIEDYLEFCIKFYDLNATLHSFHGCVQLEARLAKLLVGHFNLGCFNLNGYMWKYEFQLKQNFIPIEIIKNVEKEYGLFTNEVKKDYGVVSKEVEKDYGVVSKEVKKDFEIVSKEVKKDFGIVSNEVKKNYEYISDKMKKIFGKK